MNYKINSKTEKEEIGEIGYTLEDKDFLLINAINNLTIEIRRLVNK